MFSKHRYLLLTFRKQILVFLGIGAGLALLITYQIMDGLEQSREEVFGIVQSAGYMDGRWLMGESSQAASIRLENGKTVRVRVPGECRLLQVGHNVVVLERRYRFSGPRHELRC